MEPVQHDMEQLRREALKRQLKIVEERYPAKGRTPDLDAIVVDANKPTPLYRAPAQRASGSDRMTSLGEHFALPHPATPPPPELQWACATCGIIEPLFLPSGRWIKRSCSCERTERQRQRDQTQLMAWATEQRSQCFGGWLGRQWISESIVKEMTHKTFATYDRERFPEAYDVAQKFVSNPRGNLIFHGDYGTGKTHLTVAVVNDLLERGTLCRFASAPQLYESYLETRKQYDQMAHIQLQERLYSCTLLILDDIDKSEPTNDMHRFYFTLFDERYKARKSTIITTNRYDELAHYIGKAALSRISRAMQVIEMVGDDYRMEESFDW
jgi:DNA replication protein DnaC